MLARCLTDCIAASSPPGPQWLPAVVSCLSVFCGLSGLCGFLLSVVCLNSACPTFNSGQQRQRGSLIMYQFSRAFSGRGDHLAPQMTSPLCCVGPYQVSHG